MFIAALFTIAKTWKQPKCPSIDEWIKKMWFIYTTEYYSAIKKNEIMPFAATWMDLEIIILSEISQTDKDKYHMISLTCKMIQMNLFFFNDTATTEIYTLSLHDALPIYHMIQQSHSLTYIWKRQKL